MEPSTPSKHDWILSEDSRDWQRHLLAGENMWQFRAKSVRELYLGGTILLTSPLHLSTTLKAINKAWCLLQLDHLERACSSGCDDSEHRYMKYLVPSVEVLKEDWALQILLIETSGKFFRFWKRKRIFAR